MTNKYTRNFTDSGALKRPGRIDRRMFADVANAGDGNPGLMRIIKNLQFSFYDRYVLDGCVYDGSTVTDGHIMWDKEVIEVTGKNISLNNGEYLYIDSTGVVNKTAVLANAENELIISYKVADTEYDVAPKFKDNELKVFKMIINTSLDYLSSLTVSGDADVSGDLNVDGDIVMSGGGDITGTGSIEATEIIVSTDLDMNNNKITNLADSVNPQDALTVSDLTTHENNVNAHIDNLTDITTRDHSDLQNIGVSDHHVKYTDADARGAINDVIGSDGKFDDDMDLDANDLDNVNKIIMDEISAPSGTASHGTLYVKSSDHFLYFKNGAGEEYLLIECTSYGYFGVDDYIDYFNTEIFVGGATDSGTLTIDRDRLTGVCGSTLGFFCGGYTSSPRNNIDYIDVTIPVGNASDVGDLTVARSYPGGCEGSAYGFIMGGRLSGGGRSNVVDYIDVTSTTQNATDKGDLTIGREQVAGVSGTTYGFCCGGIDTVPAYSDVIDYITLTSGASNAIDKGNLINHRSTRASVNNLSYGFIGCNETGHYFLDYIDLTTTSGNAVSVGNGFDESEAGVSGKSHGFMIDQDGNIGYIHLTTLSQNIVDRGGDSSRITGYSAGVSGR